MMINKQQIIEGLQKKIEAGEPIIATAAGAGLVARVEEKNGTDLIVVYNSGLYRMNGITSITGNLPIGDANQTVYDMGKNQILLVVDHTPVVASIYGVDPTRDMGRFLMELWNIGYRCVINFPTIGRLSGPIRKELEQVDLGLVKEVERLQLAAKLEFVTLAYCYDPEGAEILAKADIDIIVPHAGLTAGGNVGVKIVVPADVAIRKTEEILPAAKKTKPDIIILCHGDLVVSPEDIQRVLKETYAMGFVAASSIERLPVEKGISGTLKALKSIRK